MSDRYVISKDKLSVQFGFLMQKNAGAFTVEELAFLVSAQMESVHGHGGDLDFLNESARKLIDKLYKKLGGRKELG